MESWRVTIMLRKSMSWSCLCQRAAPCCTLQGSGLHLLNTTQHYSSTLKVWTWLTVTVPVAEPENQSAPVSVNRQKQLKVSSFRKEGRREWGRLFYTRAFIPFTYKTGQQGAEQSRNTEKRISKRWGMWGGYSVAVCMGSSHRAFE